MNKRTQKTIAIGMVLVVALAAVSYAVWSSGSGKEKLQFGYVAWDGEVASTNVLTLVLKEAGFEVEMLNVEPGLLYQSLADGDLDFTTSAWLPVTHKSYWEAYGDDIAKVSTNLENCTIGLAVPKYVYDAGIISIEDLNERKAQFGGKIFGIDAGAGIMIATERAIESYSLNYELVTSSSAGMITQLDSAYSNGKWIAVTMWTPHWAFERWDLVMLDDPKKEYGGEEQVETLARQGFQEENPEAYAIIERFNWTQEDIQSVMLDIANGMSEKKAAQKWIDAHRDTVDYWING